MSTDTTRTAILDAAERRFAEHGFDGTSIRMITGDAGVNVASIHYHFGSKDEVLRGVTDRVAGRIAELRREQLAAAVADAAPEVPSVEAILEAFIRPDLMALQEVQDRAPTVARFLGRTYSDQTPWIQEMAGEQYGEVRETFFPLLAEALPHLDGDELAWRMSRVVAVIVHLFATWPANGMSEAETEATLARTVTFLAAGLRAPSTEGDH